MNSKKCYKIFTWPKFNFTWQEARDFCTGGLVSITSEPLQKFIESLTTGSLALWIGAFKRAGSLMWDDKSQWGYVPAGTDVNNANDWDRGVIQLTDGTPDIWYFTKADNVEIVHGCICQYSIGNK